MQRARILIFVALAIAATLAYVALRGADSRPWFATTTKPAGDNSSSKEHLSRSNMLQVQDRSVFPNDSQTQLFSDVPDSQIDYKALEGFFNARHIGAYRIVNVNTDLFRGIIRQADGPANLSLKLLSSDPVKLTVKAAEEYSSGWKAGLANWRGHIADDPTSQAYFVCAADGSLNGVVTSLELGRIKIEPINGTPYHIIWKASGDSETKID